MAIEEAMLVEMFKSQVKMEVKLDSLLEASRMEEMEDMMEEATKESEGKGEHMSMDGGLESMLGSFIPDISTIGMC